LELNDQCAADKVPILRAAPFFRKKRRRPSWSDSKEEDAINHKLCKPVVQQLERTPLPVSIKCEIDTSKASSTTTRFKGTVLELLEKKFPDMDDLIRRHLESKKLVGSDSGRVPVVADDVADFKVMPRKVCLADFLKGLGKSTSNLPCSEK